MSDRIVLAGMRFDGRHGVLEHERRVAQPFEVDVELVLDLEPAGRTDDLADTVDYGEAYEICRGIVESTSYRLIEALAGAIAGALLERLAVPEVCVRVRKPRAPLPGTFDYAGVEIRRRRGSAAPA